MNAKKLMAMGLVVTLSMSVVACSGEEEAAEISKMAVEVQTPESGELSVETAYIGSITPQEQVYVIPMTSGTVTEVNYAVGDTVQEGDILFKIDDEAAQLQLKNANAAYSAAQAGVTAQSDGARDLQNYQTEEQIRQLREQLYETDDTIDDMEDDLGDVRDQIKNITAALGQANIDLETSRESYYDQKDILQPQIDAKQADIDKILADAAQNNTTVDVSKQQEELDKLKNELGGYESTYLKAQTSVTNYESLLATLNTSKAQLKSGIESAEDGVDTLNDNITMAEQAYAITQNEIYPQSDAASAASLSQAAIGIDSAKMQLDFCTVEAPISGVVESVSVEKNGMAAAGSPAFIISNKESMTVTFHVAEKAKNALAVGDEVTVEHNGETFNGSITEIVTMAGQQTKLFQVKASVTGASDSLPNGVSVKVYATTQRQESDLIIPYDAVYFSAGDAYVYCVEDGKAVKTAVKVGLMNDTDVVIEEGLTADSQIIANWSTKLRNGADVEILVLNGEAVTAEETSAETETEAAEEAE